MDKQDLSHPTIIPDGDPDISVTEKLRNRRKRKKTAGIILLSTFFLIAIMAVYFVRSILLSISAYIDNGQVLGTSTSYVSDNQFAIQLLSYSGEDTAGIALFTGKPDTVTVQIQYDNGSEAVSPTAVLQEGTCLFPKSNIRTLNDFQAGISTTDIKISDINLKDHLPISIVLYTDKNTTDSPLACGEVLSEPSQSPERI